jgi:hypothetical protein
LKEGRSSFFEKKAAKKLLLNGSCGSRVPKPPEAKVFCVFFSKKKCLLDL